MTLHVSIWVSGYLSEAWAEWFEGLGVYRQPGGVTRIEGPLSDQAALAGLPSRTFAIGLPILSLRCEVDSQQLDADNFLGKEPT